MLSLTASLSSATRFFVQSATNCDFILECFTKIVFLISHRIQELMYFLNEFFGSQNDQMEDIARNVVRFQNNEPLEWKQVHTKMPAAQSITKSVVTASAEITRLDNPSAQKQSTTVQQNKAAISIIPKQPKGKPSRVPKAVSPVKVESSTTANEAVKQTGEKGNDKPTTKPSAIPLPPKGEAKVDCGCFGTTHRALINCLFCGRILCEREGYGFCPHCGYLVEEDNENMRRQWYVPVAFIRPGKESLTPILRHCD